METRAPAPRPARDPHDERNAKRGVVEEHAVRRFPVVAERLPVIAGDTTAVSLRRHESSGRPAGPTKAISPSYGSFAKRLSAGRIVWIVRVEQMDPQEARRGSARSQARARGRHLVAATLDREIAIPPGCRRRKPAS